MRPDDSSAPDTQASVPPLDFGEFISGGYFLVKPTKRPESFSTLLPENIVTLSACVGEVAPGMWAVDWGGSDAKKREEEAARFGIPADRLPDLVDWVTAVIAGKLVPEGSSTHDAREVLPFGFSSLAAAREFHARFIPGGEILILGVGLHISLLPSLYAQRDRDINNGLGLLERIDQRQAIAPGAVLGFEPLGFEGVSFHSWICCESPDKLSREIGVQPGSNGFIADLPDAIRAAEHIRHESNPEPAIWLPWLIVQYPLTPTNH